MFTPQIKIDVNKNETSINVTNVSSSKNFWWMFQVTQTP